MAWENTTVTSDFNAQQYAENAMSSRAATRSGSTATATYDPFGNIPIVGNLSLGDYNVNSHNINAVNVFDFRGEANVFSEFDAVGINATKVGDMQTAIRDAVTKIQDHIDGIQESTSTDNAFKSEDVKTAVLAYVSSVEEYCKALTSNLLAFNDKLESIKNAWQSSTESYASENITPGASNLSSNATYYTPQS